MTQENTPHYVAECVELVQQCFRSAHLSGEPWDMGQEWGFDYKFPEHSGMPDAHIRVQKVMLEYFTDGVAEVMCDRLKEYKDFCTRWLS